MAITQLRPYMPEELMSVEWISVGSNAFNEAIPFYANVTTTPDYLANTGAVPTTENFYWANRMIGALADAHYATCIAHVERYQKNLARRATKFWRRLTRARTGEGRFTPIWKKETSALRTRQSARRTI